MRACLAPLLTLFHTRNRGVFQTHAALPKDASATSPGLHWEMQGTSNGGEDDESLR